MKIISISLGAIIGALLRYFVSTGISQRTQSVFPFGTLIVNLTGCLMIGLFFGMFERINIAPNTRALIFTGFLGAYTTFSTYGLECFNLTKANNIKYMILNVLISTIGGIGLVFLGYFLSRIIAIWQSKSI